MNDTILSLIGAAWQLGVAGLLGYVFVCVVFDYLFPEHEDEAEEGAEYAEFADAADEFEGDAWDRARDIEQDRRWEIAS